MSNKSYYKKIIKEISRQFLLIISLTVFVFSVCKVSYYLFDYMKARKTYSKAAELYYSDDFIKMVDNSSTNVDIIQIGDTFQYENIFTEDTYESKHIIYGGKDNTEKNTNKVTNEIESNNTAQKLIQPKFISLLEINEEVVGWVTIPETNIDYPVVKAADNDFYLGHDFEKNKNRSGSIFMDFRNSPELKEKNIILYGHHMKDGSMFNNINKYKNKDFFYQNNLIRFDTLYEDYIWEVFSVYVTDVNFNYIQTKFPNDGQYLEFLKTINQKSIYKTEIEFSDDDVILTLSTCSYEFENARTVIHAIVKQTP